jgi:hypothetical protein
MIDHDKAQEEIRTVWPGLRWRCVLRDERRVVWHAGAGGGATVCLEVLKGVKGRAWVSSSGRVVCTTRVFKTRDLVDVLDVVLALRGVVEKLDAKGARKIERRRLLLEALRAG